MATLPHNTDGMRDQDKVAFRQVCRDKELWILVRQTNPHSLKYIGLPGYTPKPIFVKPKTAQANVPKPRGGAYELRGLVVDPTRHWQAFDPAKVDSASRIWRAFAEQHHIGANAPTAAFKVDEDPNSKHFGCLMIRMRQAYHYIHGDYDLKDIVEVGTEDWNLALPWMHEGVRHNEILLLHHDLWDIVADLNRRIGVDMVQHGSEAQYADHADEPIVVFSIDGHQWVLKDQSAVETFYLTYFKGRRAGIQVGIDEAAQPDLQLADPRLWPKLRDLRRQ
jgi:hypothetical protein